MPKTINRYHSTDKGLLVADGSLYYDEIGRGIPIIIVHGGPGVLNQGYFQPQLFQLAAKHRLIFYDQRGSGKSLNTILDEKHINIDQFVKDLEVLRTSLGLEKFILIGHYGAGYLQCNMQLPIKMIYWD